MAPLPLIQPPLQNSKFNLDIFSVAGFFGGDEVVQSISTLHLYKGRKWRGWYNSPGTYTVAKSLGRIANSRFWRGLFPGACQDPATAFGLDGRKGPKYLAALSGTEMTMTGHIGYLLTDYVKELKGIDLQGNNRTTKATPVTIVDISDVVKLDNLLVPSTTLQLVQSYVTMISSLACSIFSLILFNDKFCFSAILLGTLIGGISSLIIGMGSLSLRSVFTPASGSPPGDGVLIGEGIIVLRGTEAHVNAITKGKFYLNIHGDPTYNNIGICSMAYFFQFITQLFLIPQGNLAGQLMFLTSFAIAWINNCVHASIDKEAIQIELMKRSIKMEVNKYILPSRTMATFFACLALRHSAEPEYQDVNVEYILKSILPNDTTVWNTWRRAALAVLESREPPQYLNHLLKDEGLKNLRSDQQELLGILLHDASVAYTEYHKMMNKNTSPPVKQTSSTSAEKYLV